MIGKRSIIGALVFCAFLVGALAGYLGHQRSSDKFAFLRDHETLAACLDAFGHDRTSEVRDGDLLYCYTRIHSQRTLNDFGLRRHVFETQYVSDVVLLWMVVFITLSGVIFSGVQIFTSYELVASGKRSDHDPTPDSTLEIEKGKLSLKSSVTGLFILLISLAFFYLFIKFVYKIEEIAQAGQQFAGSTSGTSTQAPEPVGEGDFFDGAGALMPADAEPGDDEDPPSTEN